MAGITRKSCVALFSFHCVWLFKSFEFGKRSRISDKNLVILEFKYFQNQKWYKQAVKSARIKKSYRTY